ncbi:hypothetical protein EVG20_g6756 [Dentipellis fragilis]|uniref:BTB domain-containing protein n=1 Tax=Dentipellis fragilis TaxID=205917 RepID=A0A4Y9YJJ4_9AGAM|nr:hypothetical protein EVG20_g6756 [Dentipellis fragilis]
MQPLLTESVQDSCVQQNKNSCAILPRRPPSPWQTGYDSRADFKLAPQSPLNILYMVSTPQGRLSPSCGDPRSPTAIPPSTYDPYTPTPGTPEPAAYYEARSPSVHGTPPPDAYDTCTPSARGTPGPTTYEADSRNVSVLGDCVYLILEDIRKEDLEAFLGILYRGPESDLNPATFPVLAGALRFSSKYGAVRVRNTIMFILKSIWSSDKDLHLAKNRAGVFNAQAQDQVHPARILAVLRRSIVKIKTSCPSCSITSAVALLNWEHRPKVLDKTSTRCHPEIFNVSLMVYRSSFGDRYFGAALKKTPFAGHISLILAERRMSAC